MSIVSRERVRSIVEAYPRCRIMVIGDIMLDEYMWGDVRRISPEAPVPVVEIESVTHRLGGAANVVQNLAGLGMKPRLVSLRGNESTGERLNEMLVEASCITDGIVVSETRPTTTKTRIMAKQQQVCRADREITGAPGDDDLENLLTSFDRAVTEVDGVLVSDYGKGVLCRSLLKHVTQECRERGIFVAVDPKEQHFDLYNGVDVITPNLKETHAALGLPQARRSNEEIRELGSQLLNRLSMKMLLVTLSERGMALFQREGNTFDHLPTVARAVYDVTGAGDTVISVFTASMLSGATPLEAAYIANHAAGMTVAQIGTSSVDPESLIDSCCPV